MRQTVATWLRRLADWICPLPPPPTTAVDDRALVLARMLQSMTKASGEYKRHEVYARLIKEFPAVPRRDLALAIELAVRKL
jgi:hypothetical protein